MCKFLGNFRQTENLVRRWDETAQFKRRESNRDGSELFVAALGWWMPEVWMRHYESHEMFNCSCLPLRSGLTTCHSSLVIVSESYPCFPVLFRVDPWAQKFRRRKPSSFLTLVQFSSAIFELVNMFSGPKGLNTKYIGPF